MEIAHHCIVDRSVSNNSKNKNCFISIAYVNHSRHKLICLALRKRKENTNSHASLGPRTMWCGNYSAMCLCLQGPERGLRMRCPRRIKIVLLEVLARYIRCALIDQSEYRIKIPTIKSALRLPTAPQRVR